MAKQLEFWKVESDSSPGKFYTVSRLADNEAIWPQIERLIEIRQRKDKLK